MFDKPSNANRRDILNHRDYLMRFLDELDADLTIGEVRVALINYE